MNPPIYLSAADCRGLLTPDDVLAAVETTLRGEAAGEVGWPSPRNLSMKDRRGNHYHLKACVLEGTPVAGIRLVGHQADEAAGTATRWIVLIDPATTLPLAIVDETWNYAQRTVAAMAVAARALATSKTQSLGLVGAGRLAASALTYYSRVFRLTEVRVASRRVETRAELADSARRDLGLVARPAASIAEAVRGADQVLTCTSSGKELLAEEWISPGAVVSSLETAEPGAGLFAAADLRVVDSRDQLQKELVECYGPEAPRRIDTTISDVLAERHPGRTSSGQRILVVSQGLASLDVAVANKAYHLARSRGLGAALPITLG